MCSLNISNTLEKSLKLQRSKLLKAFIDEADSLSPLFDYINEHKTGGEIPKRYYNAFYENHILRNCILDADKAFYKHAFEAKTLIENGFLYDFPQDGTYAFAQIVIDVFKFVDTKRSKQLFNDEFEKMRQSTLMYCNQIKNAEIGSDEYQEYLFGFRGHLTEVLSKVSENSLVLKLTVETFSKKYIEYESGSSSITASQLFQEVDALYHRNVKPFMDFTTTENIVIGGSFYSALQELIHYFEADSNIQEAQSLGFRRTAITSYYKDITETAETLKLYLHQLGKDRSSYLTIENAFADLMDQLEPLRTGGAKNIFLSPKDEYFTSLSVFDGLKTHTYDQRLSLDESENFERFLWHYERILNTPLPPRTQLQSATTISKNTASKKRIKEIAQIAIVIDFKHSRDIVKTLHHTLQTTVEDYTLLDLLIGLEAVLPKVRQHITRTGMTARVEDDQYFFEYHVKQSKVHTNE